MRGRGEGQIRWNGARASVRLALGPPVGRRTFVLASSITGEAEAEQRRAVLADLAARLRTAGRLVLALPLLERLASREGPRDVAACTAAIETLIRGEASPLPPKVPTFGELAGQWTENQLSERFPDHIPKRDHKIDSYRLEKHVLPVIRDVPMADGLFTLDHAQAVLSALPSDLSGATRKHVAHVVHRLVKLAVFPLRLLSADPIPAGWMPLGGTRKAMAWLYPSEDAALLACARVPLARRVLYGFLDREGMRASEAEALEWSDLDLARGVVRLDENKTDDPRAWALRPDVTKALSRWRILLAASEAKDDRRTIRSRAAGRVFPVPRDHQADQFRADLECAGIDRAELFERSATRQPIRIHDLRAGFVTVALSLGRSETWISDRTGHKSHTMIARYRRAARTAEELHLGDLAPLDAAIPELRSEDGGAPQGTAGEDGAAGGAPPSEAPPGTAGAAAATAATGARRDREATRAEQHQAGELAPSGEEAARSSGPSAGGHQAWNGPGASEVVADRSVAGGEKVNDPAVVRRAGLEPARELPRWNLNRR